MLWIFLPLSTPDRDRRRQVSRLFFLVTRRQRRRRGDGLTDDLKIGPYQELLEQRSESERLTCARRARMPAGSPGHGMALCARPGFLVGLVGRNYSSRVGTLSREATTKRGIN